MRMTATTGATRPSAIIAQSTLVSFIHLWDDIEHSLVLLSPKRRNTRLPKWSAETSILSRNVRYTIRWYTCFWCFYVEDCVKSVQNDEEGMLVAHDLAILLARGGCYVTKWTSNSATILVSIPTEERSETIKDLSFSKPTIEQALGVIWNVASDEFTF